MTWVAVAIAGSAILGAGASVYSADKAAKAGEKAAGTQIDLARETRDIIRSDTAPYRQAGYTALDALMRLSGLPSHPTISDAARYGSPDDAGVGANDFGGLGFDPDKPMSEEELRRAFQVVLQRDPSQSAINHYLYEAGPKTGGKGALAGDGLFKDELHQATGAPDPLGVFSGKEGKRRSVTFNEFLAATRGQGPAGMTPAAQEYNDMVASGKLPAFSWERLRADTLAQRDSGAPAGGGGGALAPGATPRDMVQADPGYQFRLNEGMRALERSSAARGGLLSGGFARKATRYAQDYASNEYQNIYNRISNIAGLGQVGVSQSTQGALQYGQLAHQAAGDAGYTRASAYTASGNAIQNALSQGAMAYGYYKGGLA